MSINSRLIAGSVVFALLAAGFAGFSYVSQRGSLQLTAQLYERGLEPMLSLRSTETGIRSLQARLAQEAGETPRQEGGLDAGEAADFRRTLAQTVAGLEAILASDIAPDQRPKVSALFYHATRLQATNGNLSRRLARNELTDFSERLAGVGLAMREEMDALRADTEARIGRATVAVFAALAVVLAALGGFLFVLSRAVGGPLRRLAALGRSLASGEALEPIVPKRPGRNPGRHGRIGGRAGLLRGTRRHDEQRDRLPRRPDRDAAEPAAGRTQQHDPGSLHARRREAPRRLQRRLHRTLRKGGAGDAGAAVLR
jgi:hypothetical protein